MQETNPTPVAEENPAEGAAADPAPNTEAAETVKADAAIAELKDLLQRRQAEFENFRKRVTREKAELHEFVTRQAVEELLPVLDDFERALAVACADTDYAKGMELIYQRLAEQLKRLGLEPLETVGQPFDPHLHHAVERAPVEGTEADTVAAEYRKGYNFKGKPLRPAMVKVAVKPA
jgi:molecular chaperone GrpE